MTAPEPTERRERHRSDGAGRTEEIAAELAAELRPGDVVLLGGDLGSGKTTFVRGAARALGVSGPVTSPTFTIGQRYEGRVPVSHLDLHRLAGASGLAGEDPALLDDYLTADAIAFVEWPDPAAEAIAEPAADVELVHAGGDERLITIVRNR